LDSFVVLIPAYKPSSALRELVSQLVKADLRAIVVVDDGSGVGYQSLFEEIATMPKTHLLRNVINLGKGAALKTGLKHILWRFPGSGIVTADADGQHDFKDILMVGEALATNENRLVMGVRRFDSATPRRSKFGNDLTRILFRILHGQELTDTQTGLRGIPPSLATALLRIGASGYEFELDMLITAKQLGIPTEQLPIRTIYIDGNASSHFNPVIDSMRIYLVLLRFFAASLVTAAFDSSVFYFILSWTGSALISQAVSRFLALLLNYNLNRRMVFLLRGRDLQALAKYVSTVIGSGVISYLLLVSLHNLLGISLFAAKLWAEMVLFLANFALLRDFVFVKQQPEAQVTDWTRCYQAVPPTPKLTRKYTMRTILEALHFAKLGT
jgi:glycosyltransferase involved in cell wall biosynthesis